MIIILSRDIPESDVEALLERIRDAGARPADIVSSRSRWIAFDADSVEIETGALLATPGVERIVQITPPWTLADRGDTPTRTVSGDGWRFSGDSCTLIAGPCAVETEEQIFSTARFLQSLGVPLMRAGAFKPRTSPYSFQGLGGEGLRILRDVRSETGIGIVTEVMSPGEIGAVAESADILQVGARNMQNYPLLGELARAGKPVLLKRGFGSTLEELLLAAEYLLQGTEDVILCERGIRTFEKATRNTFDVSAIPALHGMTHLPVIADPSHAVGRSDWIPAVARAAVAAGADGLMLEVHPDPSQALSDGQESLTFDELSDLVPDLGAVASAVGRPLALNLPVA